MVLIDEYQFRLMLEILTAMGLEGEKKESASDTQREGSPPEPTKTQPEVKKTA